MNLGIYSAEPPQLQATWSGTPANLIAALAERGVEMEFFSALASPSPSAAARLIHRLSPASALYSRIGSRHFSQALIEHFGKAECDIVLHVPADHIPYKVCHTKAPHVAMIDATFRQFFFPWFDERYRQRSRWIRFVSKFEMARRDAYYRESLHALSHLFVTSHWTKESLTRDYGVNPDTITVCYTGTGKIRALTGLPTPQNPRILFVARHNYLAKGAKLLLDAFRLVRNDHPGAELVIVGPSPDSLGVSANERQVSVHGFLAWEDLELLFNQSTLFVMPSRYEPYGLVYLEALKCGVPVVCSSTGGMASLVSEKSCGWVVDELNAKCLAEVLDRCLSSPEECRTRGLAGKDFVEQHCTWSTCGSVIVNQLELILANRSR